MAIDPEELSQFSEDEITRSPVGLGMIYKNNVDEKRTSISMKNPAAQPETEEPFPTKLDFQDISTADRLLMQPKRTFELKTRDDVRQLTSESIRNFLLQENTDIINRIGHLKNTSGFWNLLDGSIQMTQEAMVEGTTRSLRDTIQAPINLALAGIWGATKLSDMASKYDLDEEIATVNSTQEYVDNVFRSIFDSEVAKGTTRRALFGVGFGGSFLPEESSVRAPDATREERMQAIREVHNNLTGPFKSEWDEMSDKKKTRRIEKLLEANDQLKVQERIEQSNSAEEAANAVTDAVSILGTSLASLGGLSYAIPRTSTGLGSFGRAGLIWAGESIASGTVEAELFPEQEDIFRELTGIGFDTDVGNESNQTLRRVGNRAIENLALGGAIEVTGGTALGVLKGARKLFGNTVEEGFMTKNLNLAERYAEAVRLDDQQLAEEVAQDVKNLWGAEIPMRELEAMRPDLRQNFASIFRLGNLEDEQIEELFRITLDQKYGTNRLEDLSPNQLREFDVWLTKAENNPEFMERGEHLLKNFLRKKSNNVDRMEEEFFERADFYSIDEITPENIEEKMPFFSRYLDGLSQREGDAFTRTPAEEIWGEGGIVERAEGLVDSVDRAIGPSRIYAHKTAKETGLESFPLSYLNVMDSTHEAAVRYEAGEAINMAGREFEVPGAREMDQLFRRNDMYGWTDEALEKKEQIFKFLIGRESHPEHGVMVQFHHTLEDLRKLDPSDVPLTEDELEVAIQVRKWLDDMGEAFGVDSEHFIRQYVPYQKNLSPDEKIEQAWKKARISRKSRGSTRGSMPFFFRQRNLRDITSDEAAELFDVDIQNVLKKYLWAGMHYRHAGNAWDEMDKMVSRLEALAGPEGASNKFTKYWKSWMKEKKGAYLRAHSVQRKFMMKLARNLKRYDPTEGARFTQWLSRKRPSDAILQATYGQYLMAKQGFRFMNAAQSTHTLSHVGTDRFLEASRLIRDMAIGGRTRGADVLDQVLQQSGLRGSSDQFLDVQLYTTGEEAAGEVSMRRFKEKFKKGAKNVFGYGNISSSDKFNISRAFTAGSLGFNKREMIQQFRNGDIPFSEVITELSAETQHPIAKKLIKRRLEANRVGMIVTEDGNRLTLRQAMEMGKDRLGDFELDRQSAEYIMSRNVAFQTQWQYGKGAMGWTFWRNAGRLHEEAGEPLQDSWMNAAQNFFLPFQTWWINYMYGARQLLRNPAKNADRIAQYVASAQAYDEATSQILDKEHGEWHTFGNLPAVPFQAPGISGALAAQGLMRFGGWEQLNELKGQVPPWWVSENKEEAGRELYRMLAGRGTGVGRAKRVFDSSMNLISGQGFKKDEITQIVESSLGIDFKNTSEEEFVKAYSNFWNDLESERGSTERGNRRRIRRGID